MVDKFTEEKRSKIMSKIKSKWTAPERKIHNLLKGNKIRHKMHPILTGNPDVYLKDYNTVIFIDGCFWHKCPIHGHIPENNKDYWEKKIEKNIKRDKKNSILLENEGYVVIRIWECELKSKKFDFKNFIQNIKNYQS